MGDPADIAGPVTREFVIDAMRCRGDAVVVVRSSKVPPVLFMEQFVLVIEAMLLIGVTKLVKDGDELIGKPAMIEKTKQK